MSRSVLAAVAVATLLAGACSDGAEVTEVVCGPVEHPELQGGGHLLGDAEPPVPYSSTPGTSGFHAAGAPPEGIYAEDDPLTEPAIVLSLETGQVVAAYDPEELSDAEVSELEDLASGPLAGQLTVTPFDGDMRAPLTLNAWGTRRPCSAVDRDTVRGFVDRFGGSGPDHP